MPVSPHGGPGRLQFFLTEALVGACFSSWRPWYAPVSPHAIDFKLFLVSEPVFFLKRVLDHLSNLLKGGTFS